MSSAATRTLLLRTGAAAHWPSLRRCALQPSSPLAVTVEGSRWPGAALRRRLQMGADSVTTLNTEGTKSVPATASNQSSVPPFAFAFDIDGVLLHRSDPIPGAGETLKFLQKNEIPFILLTNGGGKTEAERIAELSAKLGVQLSESQLVQSHTPFKLLASLEYEDGKPSGDILCPPLQKQINKHLTATDSRNFHNSTILVLGSDASKARHIATGYGFRSVVTPGDILKANPNLYPFDPLSEFYEKQEILPLPKPIYDPTNASLKVEDCLKIDLILVFNDPRDWAVDIQLITDLVTSHRGYLGTVNLKSTETPEGTKTQTSLGDHHPLVVFSNSDMVWSTGYHLPRFGQGAFQAALREVLFRARPHLRETKRSAKRMRNMYFQYGKPTVTAHGFATHRLLELVAEKQQTSTASSGTAPELSKGRSDVIKNIYMIGDNPASDIECANRHKASCIKHDQPVWHGCLVKTGVWSEDTRPVKNMRPSQRPDTVQNDVLAAVKWALEKEGWPHKLE